MSIRTGFVGGYAGTDTPMKGISCARVHGSGQWEILGSAGGVPNPFHLALSPRGDVLYAAANIADGAVHALRVEPDGSLVPLAERATGGAGTVHVAVHPSGRYLLAADHDSGSVVVHDLDESGRIGPVRSTVEYSGSGPHPVAQLGPHPHQVVVDPLGGHVLVPDKGTDSIWLHPFADGDLGAGTRVELPAGTGPRQLVLHPDGRHAYVVGELTSTVTVLTRDPAGGLAVAGSVSTLPEGTELWNAPSTAALSADGSVLCVGNRGHESVAILAVEDGGAALRLVGAPRVTEAPGVTTLPWDLVLDGGRGRPLVAHVANQLAGTVVAFEVDPVAATLTPVGQPAVAPTPACLVLR